MEVLVFDPKSTNCGYFLQNQDGTISPVGFRDLMNKLVRFSELDGYVVLAHDDEDIPPEECIMFDKETFSNRNVIKYLKGHGAINSLFVKIFGIYSQTDARILQNKIKVVK